MRRVPLFLVLFVLPILSIFSQSYTVASTVFLPRVFYVGDRVEMRISLRVPQNAALERPAEMPTPQWGEIHSISVSHAGGDATVRIIFTPFRPGTQSMPVMKLGDITLEGVNVYVKSILQEGEVGLAPPRSQLLLPSTRLVIGLGVGVLVILPLGWFVFYRWGRSRLVGLIARYRERQPNRRMQRVLKQLSADVENRSGREFYIVLQEELRRYLSRKLDADCMSATTWELRLHLGRLTPDQNDTQLLLSLFQFGDLVKFAGKSSSARIRKEHLQQVGELLARVERLDHSTRRSSHVGV